MPGSLLVVIAYILLAIFVVVFAYRAYSIAKLPVHLRWELAPVPHEKGKSHYGGSYFEEFEWWTKPREKSLVNEASYMFQEILFLKSLWEHNRKLWWFSFPFHFGMYLLIGAGGLLLIGTLLSLLRVTDSTLAGMGVVVGPLAAVGFVLGAIGAIGLLIMRLTDSRLKAFTSSIGLFNLVLLLAVFATGIYAFFAADGFAASVSQFVGAVFTANTSVALSGILVAHLVLALFFLAYLPFTPMMHFVAKYFTYHQVRWDDTPLQVGGRTEKQVQQLLEKPMTWSAPHVNADGKKNWVDIATEETGK
jgi:nitrate reductase gamma subunit